MRGVRLTIAFICLHISGSFAASIEEQINNFINQVEIPRLATIYPDANIKITLNNLASLNYLPACQDETVSISNQREGAAKRTNYVISCSNPVWKSYVPATQSILVSAIRTSAPIKRGDTINQSNTSIGEVDLVDLRGQFFTAERPPYGLVASRNIRTNTFITSTNTKQPLLIKKGDQVLIVARSGSIQVKMNGISLENGIESQQIRVKNASSGRIIYGKVVSSGEVLVNY